MKPLLYLVGGLAAGAGAGCLYLNSQIKEQTFPEMSFHYQEEQCSYKQLHQKYKALENFSNKFKSSFDNNLFSIMGLYYDNPKFLKDKNKCRVALGFVVEKKLPQQDNDGLTTGRTSITIPSFKAMTIPMLICKCSCLFGLYYYLLLRKYEAKYGNQLVSKKIAFFPMGERYSAKGSYVFAPVPDDINHLKFVKAPQPELNNEGKAYNEKRASGS